MEKVVERFINYARQHTTSDPDNEKTPSTDIQFEFMKKLEAELRKIGLQEVELDENGYLMATIPANNDREGPVVGFIAHVDTSPDFEGKDVEPRIIKNYEGGEIKLNDVISIKPDEFPEILKYKGQDIITAGGNTLLGADDKAGVAEIVTAAEIMINNPSFKHGKIKIGFTPDEEIGRGADKFDVKKFGADFAYTLDGGEIGELEYENFNAAGAKIKIQGRSVHPGFAKDKMINATLVAHKLISMLPSVQRPEHTDGYEGFFHLMSLTGNVERAEMQFIIRDHSLQKFNEKKELLKKITSLINLEYKQELVQLDIKDQYFNMREKIEPVMFVVDIACEAMKKADINPTIKAIRGGTDGARLSYEGLPCPNIFAGGHNFHGPYEFIPIPSMLKAVEVILNIAELAQTK